MGVYRLVPGVVLAWPELVESDVLKCNGDHFTSRTWRRVWILPALDSFSLNGLSSLVTA